jgi:chromosome segregation ATPase
MSLQIEN